MALVPISSGFTASGMTSKGMPELPEVETVARELNRKLKNQTIKGVEVLLGKIVSLGPGTVPSKRQNGSHKTTEFAKLLKGRKIRSVSRRAKLLIFDFYRDKRTPSLTRPAATLSHPFDRLRAGLGEGVGERQGAKSTEPDLLHQAGVHIDGSLALLVHLKMTGQFIYFKTTELNKRVRIINKKTAPLHSMPGRYTHAIFTFTDGSKLFYNDVRQFGYLKLVIDAELAHVKELNEFGPEPLSKKFTLNTFLTAVKNAHSRKIAIKPLLMEPKFIAGIGNIYSDEILFRAKVAPARQAKTLKPLELRAIYRAIPFILKKGIAAHGSSVGDFIRTDGSFGSMGKYHFVYGRAGKKCKLCSAIIISVKFGGRTGSFCPKCQK